MIEEDEDIEIIEELGQEGKEWIKLFSCPIWCKNDDFREDIYILPKYTQKWFISCNCVKKAIEEIIFRPQGFDLSRVDEHYRKEERKKIFLLEEENKILKERLKKYEEKEEEEDEDDYSDFDDESNEEDDDQESDDEEEEEDEDENSKINNSKDDNGQDDMDIED